uniref:Uncharacterized protein n=1 Tax=Arundo donax TaxID=35708 RepID=A0A0A9EFR6_ARUDO
MKHLHKHIGVCCLTTLLNTDDEAHLDSFFQAYSSLTLFQVQKVADKSSQNRCKCIRNRKVKAMMHLASKGSSLFSLELKRQCV